MNKVDNILTGLGERKVLIESEVKTILKEYKIPVPEFFLAKNENDLKSSNLKFPVVMKVSSPKILHKSDVGGVILNIKDKQELLEKFHVLKNRFPEADVFIENMETGNVEVIIGLLNDPTFGITIMFGIGGIFTEIYQDVVFRVVPIEHYDAEQMVMGIKARKMLEGFRNIKADREAVIETLLKLSKLGEDFENKLDQMDLNPVLVKEQGVVVVDAKMILI